MVGGRRWAGGGWAVVDRAVDVAVDGVDGWWTAGG